MRKKNLFIVVSIIVATTIYAQNPVNYTGTAYPDGVAPTVPCQIIARNWDNGGEGVALQYPWGADWGKGGDVTIRPEDNLGVTVWPTDGTGLEQLTSFKAMGNGQEPDKVAWVRYSVNVEKAAQYRFTIQYVAGGYEADRLIKIDMGGTGAVSDAEIDLVYKNSTTNWAHGIPADTTFLINLTPGLHVITFTNQYECDFDLVKFEIALDEPPYTGKPYPDEMAPDVPTEVIARNWDIGGEGVAFHWPWGEGTKTGDLTVRSEDDMSVVVWPEGGVEQLTGFKNDAWVKYTVNVPKEGEYAFNVSYVAGGNEPIDIASRLVKISLGGGGQLTDGYIDFVYPNSTENWSHGTPRDTTFLVNLSVGLHTIKFWNLRNSDFDLVKFSISILESTYSGTAYPDGVSPSIPVEIIARNWDNGGEGVAFHYPFASYGKAGDPDVRPSDLMGVTVWPDGGFEQLTSFKAPDNTEIDSAWVNYSIQVPEDGDYDLNISYIAYGNEPVDIANRLVTINIADKTGKNDSKIDLVYVNSTDEYWLLDGTPADTTFTVHLTKGERQVKFINKRNCDFNLIKFGLTKAIYRGTAYPDGTPPDVPVEVIARNWDNGGEGIAFHWPWGEGKAGNADTTIRPEDNMSITVWPADGFEQLSGLKSPDNTGDNPAWVRYSVNVPQAGEYDLKVSYIAGGNEPVDLSNRLIKINLFGSNRDNEVKIDLVYKNSTEGWAHGIPVDTVFTVSLAKGVHVVEFANHRACDFNLVKFGITKHVYAGTAYPDGVPPTVPCEVIARNWDNGGEGVAFHWPWGAGSKTGDLTARPEDDMSVVVWPEGGVEQLTGFKNNAWVKYTVKVPTTGYYSMTISYIFGGSEEDRLINIDLGGEGVGSDSIISFKYDRSTVDWADGTPKDTIFNDLYLTAGVHTIKFTNPKNADFDLVKFTIGASTKVDQVMDNVFQIYPTIVRNSLIVNLKDAVEHRLIINDISGVRVIDTKLYNNHNTIDVSKLNPGVYLITINDTTKRFVKQ
ncbi:MAG: T9SS type A sorting domain-containing protein [Clostridiaceae bacterium]|jgi:hypothetical protein|nr:T9SS type A sorting domain-containing protein [Clostridiaceae bacterium]